MYIKKSSNALFMSNEKKAAKRKTNIGEICPVIYLGKNQKKYARKPVFGISESGFFAWRKVPGRKRDVLYNMSALRI